MENILQRVIDSTDINEIVNNTMKICMYIYENNGNSEVSYIEILNEKIKILEDAIKILDIVIIKDILEYELLNYIS